MHGGKSGLCMIFGEVLSSNHFPALRMKKKDKDEDRNEDKVRKMQGVVSGL